MIGGSSAASNVVIGRATYPMPNTKYNYLVKIVNPEKKSEFEVQSLKSKEKYSCLEELKACVVMECKEKVPSPLRVIGYIETGHGLSGRKK